jgi:hypothetical protein
MILVMSESEYEEYSAMLDNGIAQNEAVEAINGKKDFEVYVSAD